MAGAAGTGAPGAAELVRLLRPGGVSDAALQAALGAAATLCGAPPGAEAFLAAGGLDSIAALLRSASPAVNSEAMQALTALTNTAPAVVGQLAADPGAAAALVALMERPPASRDGSVFLRPLLATAHLARMAGGLHLRSPPGKVVRNPVTAAVVRGGGMAHAVELLRDVLQGGDEPSLAAAAAADSVLNAIAIFCDSHPAAAAAANAAGALPLAARAVAAAGRDPRPQRADSLAFALTALNLLAGASPADAELPLAAQPALPAALSRALELAAAAGSRGAPGAGGCTEAEVKGQHLARTATRLLGQMLSGPGRGGAAASSFARAGGATHLVSAPPGVPLAWHRQHASWCVQLDVRARLLGSPRAWLAHGVLANVASATQRPGSGLGRPIPTASDTLARTQVSLLRAPLPDELRRDVLAAVSGVAVYAEARRALVAAGAEAAVEALLAGGAAALPTPLADDTIEWADVERAAHQALQAIREPALANPRPAAAADAPQCAVCGKRAAATPGGRQLMRCAGCRGPERWCSKECQRESWLGGHREVCRQRQAAAAAPPAGI
jgi:hypothetical protein